MYISTIRNEDIIRELTVAEIIEGIKSYSESQWNSLRTLQPYDIALYSVLDSDSKCAACEQYYNEDDKEYCDMCG
jgi:hypothetical protein